MSQLAVFASLIFLYVAIPAKAHSEYCHFNITQHDSKVFAATDNGPTPSSPLTTSPLIPLALSASAPPNLVKVTVSYPLLRFANRRFSIHSGLSPPRRS